MWRLLVGCSGVATVGEADDSAGVVTEFCADAPALTWDTFGQGFLIAQCDGCHASTSPDRHEAPVEVVFDTPTQAWAWAEPILAVAAGAKPTMPPNGGVAEDDRTRLQWWLRCGVPGT